MTAGLSLQPGMAPQPREGLPRPCLSCGAPMTAVETSAGLHGDATLTCRYCNSTEVMPAEAAAQERFLRLRLLQVRRAREALEAPLKSLEMVRQSWAIALVFFAAMGGWQMWQALTVAGKVPIESTLYAMLGGSAVLGVIVGYFGMIRAFRTLVRPALLAKAPVESGLSARCRCCGGDLPSVRRTQVTCGFCGANNFLDAALAQDVSNLLASEQAEYQRRAHGGHPPDGSAYQQPAKAFNRWAIIGGAVSFVVGMLLFTVLR